MTDRDPAGRPWLIPILFGLMGAVSLGCIVTGAIPYGYAIDQWAGDGYIFKGWGLLDWLIGMMGAGLIDVGLLIAGFFFRFIGWHRAPLASLCLSVVSVVFILTTYLIYTQTSDSDRDIDTLILQGTGALSLLIVSLPPFLHWMSASRTLPIAAPATASPASDIANAH